MTLAARLAALTGLSLQDPRQAARDLLSAQVPVGAAAAGLVLVAILSTLMTFVQVLRDPEPLPPFLALMVASPLRLALSEVALTCLSVVLIHRVGRGFGGQGSLADALRVTVWVEGIMLAPQALQLGLGLVSADLAGIVGLASLGLYIWLITSFIAVLHGFSSRPMVFLGMMATSLATGIVIALAMLALLGPEVLLPYV